MATRAPPTTIGAAAVARVHTRLAYSTFLGALVFGCLLHYKKIVKNGVAGYPEEWFPSVSATIGDWYPERNIFQVGIALTSGPRFALVYLQYFLHSSHFPASSLPAFVFIVGIVRTLACGGWVYVPSYEAHDFHDFAMIAYIVCNIPWMWCGVACTRDATVRKRRQLAATAFFASIIPLVYFFIQHKVHRIPGAYTRYAFFEWGLILLDVFYDSVTELDFQVADLQLGVGLSLSRGISASAAVPATDEITTPVPNSKDVPATAAKTAEVPAEKVATASQEADVPVSGARRPGVADLVAAVRGLAEGARDSTLLSFASDVYLSYVFWTIFTSLAPSFFYFSVWELGVAGHELTLLSTMSPALLTASPVRAWAQTRDGRAVLWGVSLVGIAAYLIWSPFWRMLAVAVANMGLMVGKAVDWAGSGTTVEKAGYEGLLLGLGLLLSSLSKHANHSNNPLWPILTERSGGYNKTGLLLALLAVYEQYTRVDPAGTGETQEPTPPEKTIAPKPKILPVVPASQWLPPSLALGSLIFTLHQLLSDSSTLIAWSWTGYPIRGPVPNLHGSLTILVQATGLAIPLALSGRSASAPSLLAHPLWLACGSAGAYVMYSYKDWTGYAGGLGLGLFLMSVTPLVLQRAAAAAGAGPGSTVALAKVFTTAWAVVSVFDFANTLTVAYAFVPGGVYLRERTDLVLGAQLLLLAPAFRWPRAGAPPRAFSVALPHPASPAYLRALLALTSVLAVLATLYRLPVNTPHPHRTAARIINAGIWTMHFGIDNEGRDSQRRMRDLIKDMELDIVGLLETDLHRIPYGNRDLTRVVAEELGYFVDLGPGPNQHTWGAVLLSKFPIINSTHHLLPSPNGELAPAIQAVLDIYGTATTVIVSHNGQEEDPLDRELQSTELARIMASTDPQPLIFLGYVVTKPHAPRPAPYEIMVADGKVHDIDDLDWDRWCEYIFYRGLYRTAYARVSRSTITDTELQIGQFVVPKHGHPVADDSHDARYLRAWKEALPEPHWFPMDYYGNEHEGGKRGHFYHVFGTPLYYQIPEGAVL